MAFFTKPSVSQLNQVSFLPKLNQTHFKGIYSSFLFHPKTCCLVLNNNLIMFVQ